MVSSKKRGKAGHIFEKDENMGNLMNKKTMNKLPYTDEELAFQNEEKAKRAAELLIANKELAFQNEEKSKRAAELAIANKELKFQNVEKSKRAAELVIANKELKFQNEEKSKRAAELVLANEELAFQNEEKAKRAAELLIANKELTFQNEEKSKRAAELVLANEELAFQNEEKAKRAAELLIANRELTIQQANQKKRIEEIIYINDHDYMTNLCNRRYCVESFETLNNPTNMPLGIMMSDINGLKIFNDAYGHDVGDQALKTVAAVLSETFEAKDVIARIGGDEFAVLLPNTTLEKMQGYEDALRLSMSKKTIMNIVLSIATGFDIMTNSGRNLDEMLKSAENHMYRNKFAEGVTVRNHAIQAILNTMTEKYEPEKIHSARVSAYCRKIGEVLQLSADDLEELAMAGLFHDIGKISIPDAIIQKPGKLTPEEFEIMKTHTQIGYHILRAADQYSDLAIHALSHHERWDGDGYPRGLKAEQIPLFSRIVCISDSFEAMTAVRSYKKAMTVEEAKKELIRCSGSQFDPKLVEVFVGKVLPEAEA